MATLDSLTPDLLRQLYVEEDLTDTEIAAQFATYQVKVNRLRMKWGITTRAKTDRLGLPDALTPRQQSILVGSMLGDGGLRRTGGETAGYVEHHSVAQREYLDWKASEWGAYLSKVIPSDKGEHKGFRLLTHGCRALQPFWQTFYPSGCGEKVFTRLNPDLFDDLALAVWFMDDGSRTDSYVRFSVGPDLANQRVQLQLLRRANLDVEAYGEKGDVAIHVKGRSSLTRFVDRVAPYMHPSMEYKLDVRPRSMGAAPRDTLTQSALAPLVERGLRPQAIADIFNVSRTSVNRALAKEGFRSNRTGRPSKGDPVQLTVEQATSMVEHLDLSEAGLVDEVVRILLRTEIPIVPVSYDDAQHDVALLRRCPTVLESGTFTHISRAGSQVCGRHFDYRWDARYREQPSVRTSWYNEASLRSAVQFQIRVGDPVTPIRVFRALQAVVRGPTNFRPSFARALVQSLCPEKGLVLDPCAGYGGRAAGTMAAGRQYIGVDPHPKAPHAFQGLREDFKGDLTFIHAPFEEAVLHGVEADLILTSPPYFSVERYSDDPTQSWVRYKTWESWVEGFLQPFVIKSWTHLRPGRTFCVNTKNVKDGRRVYPIADELQRLSSVQGFIQEASLEMPLGRIGKDARSEPIFLFRKPL